MRRYPHCKTTQWIAFYGLVMAVLVLGVTSREMFLSNQAAPVPPGVVGTF